MEWTDQRVLLTGGASFIGSRIAESLLARGAHVRIADNFSTGTVENLAHVIADPRLEIERTDLRNLAVARHAMRDVSVVFHLAATHGGRGYIVWNQAACAANLLLDGAVIAAAAEARVSRFVFASSACVYPATSQGDTNAVILLHEDMVRPPYEADNLYGWGKLMAEMTLTALHRETELPVAICRYFTVYGPRGGESHAIHSMIRRALDRQDPFDVWGDGRQIRNWTYVDDVVNGTILAAERIADATPINLGTTARLTVREAAERVCRAVGHAPRFRFLPAMPTGPLNRVADNARARALLGWVPKVAFDDGLEATIDWYRQARDGHIGRVTRR